MRKFAVILTAILLFSASTQAQQANNYEDSWKQVQKFEEDNLPKSALKEVDKIYASAKKENNTPQLIKTLLFKSKYALILEEDAQLNIINTFNTEILTAKFPLKNMLQNVLASDAELTLFNDYLPSLQEIFIQKVGGKNEAV